MATCFQNCGLYAAVVITISFEFALEFAFEFAQFSQFDNKSVCTLVIACSNCQFAPRCGTLWLKRKLRRFQIESSIPEYRYLNLIGLGFGATFKLGIFDDIGITIYIYGTMHCGVDVLTIKP